MSKASEWAEHHRNASAIKPALRIVGDGGDLTLEVDDTMNGVRLYIPGRGWFDERDALVIAEWLVDTFGEPNASGASA